MMIKLCGCIYNAFACVTVCKGFTRQCRIMAVIRTVTHHDQAVRVVFIMLVCIIPLCVSV